MLMLIEFRFLLCLEANWLAREIPPARNLPEIP